jgi:hypothetical protein
MIASSQAHAHREEVSGTITEVSPRIVKLYQRVKRLFVVEGNLEGVVRSALLDTKPRELNAPCRRNKVYIKFLI